MRHCLLRAVFLLLPALVCEASGSNTEILWDSYGVPHIFAPDRQHMFYAHGWAQMRNQADLLLQLYGESRGRAAEYWGADYAPLDRWLLTNGVAERARQWYDAQSPEFRSYVDAFAAGINGYAREHPQSVAEKYRCVLPVTGIDVVGHALRVVHYMYMGSRERLARELEDDRNRTQQAELSLPGALGRFEATSPGSNTWAIGPSRSADGKAMLLINPHLAWGETFYRYMEVHLKAPDYDLYGAPQIGFPVPVVGFNRHAGWGRTVNTIDTVDFYRLKLAGNGYLVDGAVKDFETAERTLKIKQSDGTLKTETVMVRNSIFGPVVHDAKGATVAMHVAGLDRPKMLEQWFRMGEAQNLAQFQTALKMMAVPMWNANYADAEGHILLVFDGLVPKRPSGKWGDWARVVPGDTTKTLWSEYVSYDELPKSLDPPAGFNQNTNEPPWTMTLPELDPARYPAYLAPGLATPPTFRTFRSLRLLAENPRMTFDQFVAAKHSTRLELADAILPDLLAAAANSRDQGVAEAAAVLKQWDHETEATSRGAVLFQLFVDEYFGAAGSIDRKLRVPWDPAHALASSKGLADPENALPALKAAASKCREMYGSLDVPWGEVYRFASGTADVPGNGAGGRVGSIRTIQFGDKRGKRFYASHGETFVCAIEFAEPQRSQCLLSYGNASQHGSPHLEDQLPLMQAKKLHPVWREREEVRAHLELEETLPAMGN